MIKYSFCKKITISLLLVAIIAAGFLCAMPCDVASAYSYGGQDASSLWYYSEDFLDVENAKTVVEGWDLSSVSQPIVIAVIDTGINANNNLFKDVLATNEDGDILGYNSTSEPVDGKVNITDDSADRHGTGVAGTIAMLIKEFGLEDYIKIYPIKANNKDNANEFGISSLTKAVEWAVNNASADVINMSLGFTSENYNKKSLDEKNAFETAIESARRQAVVVAAAGNKDAKNSLNDEGYTPAALPGVIGVMNQTSSNTLAEKSYSGENYTLCAPGYNIYTLGEGGYKTVSGTSQSSAIVSFATALLKLRLTVEDKANDAVTLANIISNISQNKLSNSNYYAIDLFSVVSLDTDNLVNYKKPTAIEIVCDGALGTGDYANSIYMRADATEEITLVARVLPIGETDPDLESGIEWYITKCNEDGEQIGAEQLLGKGASIKYLPTEGGYYEIVATHPSYDIVSQKQLVYIEFGTYYVGEVRVTLAKNANDDVDVAPSNATVYTNEVTRFALTGMQYLDKDVETKWFVNGQYVASGNTFDFKPTKSGTYYITAQYGDNYKVDLQFKFTAEVKSVVTKPLYLSLLIAGIAIVCGGAVLLGVKISRKKKTRFDDVELSREDTQDNIQG